MYQLAFRVLKFFTPQLISLSLFFFFFHFNLKYLKYPLKLLKFLNFTFFFLSLFSRSSLLSLIFSIAEHSSQVHNNRCFRLYIGTLSFVFFRASDTNKNWRLNNLSSKFFLLIFFSLYWFHLFILMSQCFKIFYGNEQFQPKKIGFSIQVSCSYKYLRIIWINFQKNS